MGSNKRTPRFWAAYNYDAAKTAMGAFLDERDPSRRAEALADAYRFAYGAEINARDVGDERLVKLGQAMREDTGRMVADLLAQALAAEDGLN